MPIFQICLNSSQIIGTAAGVWGSRYNNSTTIRLTFISEILSDFRLRIVYDKERIRFASDKGPVLWMGLDNS